MMSDIKYIRFEVPVGPDDIVMWTGGDMRSHSDVAGTHPGKPVSAGFITFRGEKAATYGRSVTLHLNSKPEDADLVNAYLDY